MKSEIALGIRSSGTYRQRGRFEDFLNHLRPMLENPPYFRRHEERRNQQSEWPERHLVSNAISHQCLAIRMLGERMRMMPKRVGALQLQIDKGMGRVPFLDLRSPPHRQAANTQLVVNECPCSHCNRQRCENFKIQGRRCNPLQVFGTREKLEDFPERRSYQLL